MTKPIIGAVQSKEWIQCPDGNCYFIIAGTIEILEAKEVIGVQMHRSDFNWVVKITGKKNDVMFIPGCQVRMIYNGTWKSEKNCYRL
jgi:hypothetical protein